MARHEAHDLVDIPEQERDALQGAHTELVLVGLKVHAAQVATQLLELSVAECDSPTLLREHDKHFIQLFAELLQAGLHLEQIKIK